MKRRLPSPTVLFAVLGSLGTGAILVAGRAPDDASQVFESVLQRVSADFVDSIAPGRLYEQAARGLVEQLNDPYAELYSPEELASFSRNTLRNDYGGLGMLIEDQRGNITVTKVFPSTPAERAGVQAGDRILKVNADAVTGWKLEQVTGKLLGPIGTSVEATFARAGVAAPMRITFTRAAIHVPAVPYAVMLDGQVGYIPFQRFNDASAAEVGAAVSQLKREGARALVLDLRGNPGGSLEQSVQLSTLFLDPGQPVVTVRYRNQPTANYQAHDRAVADSMPMVVLIDGNSASASEIVAGALQDHDRALIIGTTSFGKGLVQSLFPLEGGWALKLTTGKWYTPSGRSIQRERKFAHGHFVEEAAPDSLETDSVRHTRPAYHSDAGRTVYGGGGITPDVIIPADTISTTEQDLLRQLMAKPQETYLAIYNLSLELKGKVRPGFAIEPAWRDTLLARVRRAGVEVDQARWNTGTELVDRLLEQRLATLAFGDSAAFRRGASYDAQLKKTLELLRAGTTQRQLFNLANN